MAPTAAQPRTAMILYLTSRGAKHRFSLLGKHLKFSPVPKKQHPSTRPTLQGTVWILQLYIPLMSTWRLSVGHLPDSAYSALSCLPNFGFVFFLKCLLCPQTSSWHLRGQLARK